MARPINPATLIRRQVVLEEHDPLPDGSGAVVVRRVVHGETYRSHLLLVAFLLVLGAYSKKVRQHRGSLERANEELARINRELQEQMNEVKALSGLLPICAGSLGSAGALPLGVVAGITAGWSAALLLSAAADPMRRGLHDRVAGTVVELAARPRA